jgi:hypothetical protein
MGESGHYGLFSISSMCDQYMYDTIHHTEVQSHHCPICGEMKALTNDKEFAGKKLDDEDLVGYILAGLDSDFDSVISVVVACVETISVSELYGHLVCHE